MGVDNRGDFRTLPVDIQVKAPLAGRTARPVRPPGIIDEHDVARLQAFVTHARGSDQHAAVRPDAEIARRALVDSGHIHRLGDLDQVLPLFGAHSARSGYRDNSPSSLAGHTPRSVIRPVTRRAGVTSKA